MFSFPALVHSNRQHGTCRDLRRGWVPQGKRHACQVCVHANVVLAQITRPGPTVVKLRAGRTFRCRMTFRWALRRQQLPPPPLLLRPRGPTPASCWLTPNGTPGPNGTQVPLASITGKQGSVCVYPALRLA